MPRVPGKISEAVRYRWQVLCRVYWRPLAAIVAVVYAAIGLDSTLSSEFASTRVQNAVRLGNLIPHLSPWIWATIGLALLFLLGIEGAAREFRRQERELREARAGSAGGADLARFAEECDRLSRQINEYCAERRDGQPGHRFPTARTPDGQHRQWVNSQHEQDRYRNKTIARFQQKFATDIATLWHTAKDAGLVGADDFPGDRVYFEFRATTDHGMDRIAVVIAELGRRAKASASR
jgi:hypothetical protein